MMEPTAEQFKEAARKAAAAGDYATAKSLIARAKALEPTAQPIEKSFAKRAWEGFAGDDDPNHQTWGEVVGSVLNKGGEAMTFGLIGDEASAAVESLIPGVEYDDRLNHYRKQEEVLERDHPGLALTADIGGAMAAPLGLIGAAGKGAGLAARALKAGLGTGAMSGLYGFMEGEGGAENRMDDATQAAKWGAGFGAAIPVIGAGVQKVANNKALKGIIKEAIAKGEDTASLRKQGTAAYKAVDDAGVQIKAERFDKFREDVLDDLLSGTAYTTRPGGKVMTPKTAAVMSSIDDMAGEMAGHPGAALPWREIDSVRRQAGAAAGHITDKTDQAAGMTVINALDDMVNNLKPGDVAAGDVEALPKLLNKARDTWARMSKSQKIDDAIEAAENYAYGPSNGIKYQFKKILNTPKMARGFSETERAMMKKVIRGTIPEKVLRSAGSGLAQIGGLAGAGLSVGSAGPIGVLAGLGTTGVSMLAREGADRLAMRNAENIRKAVSSGVLNNAPMPIANDGARKLIERLLRQGTAVTVQ